MKIKKHKSESYGYVNYVEVAGIDLSKTPDFGFDFKPTFTSYSKYSGKDKRLLIIQENNNLSERDKKDLAFLYNSIYAFPLEEFNKEWHLENKDFAKGNAYLESMIKKKQCPIATPTTDLIKWFVKIYPFLNEEWKEDNKEYMQWMDDKILQNNRNLLNAFKQENIKEIKKCIKLAGNINFTENNMSPIKYVIENKNKDLLNYLLNKKVIIHNDVQLDTNHNFYHIINDYKNKQIKKLKV